MRCLHAERRVEERQIKCAHFGVTRGKMMKNAIEGFDLRDV